MRGRYLKPGFFTSVGLARCRIEARYLYEGVWCYSDALGRFKWELTRLDAAVFPYETGKYDIEALICELILTFHVLPYKGDNHCWYGWVPTYDDHFPDETKRRRGKLGSKLPEPPQKFDLKQAVKELFEEFPRIPKNSPLYVDSFDSFDTLTYDTLRGPKGPSFANRTSHTVTGKKTKSRRTTRNDAKTPPCPQKKIIDLWHKHMDDLPTVEKWTRTHEKWLQGIWVADSRRWELSWWVTMFDWLRQSDWLMGEHKKNKDWKVSLPWLVKPENWAKVRNRTYHRGIKSDVDEWMDLEV